MTEVSKPKRKPPAAARRQIQQMKLYLIRICLLAAAGGFLFGFDTSVISGVIEYISAPQVYNLSEISKGWTVSCIIIGCLIGCVIAGPLSARFMPHATLFFPTFL